MQESFIEINTVPTRIITWGHPVNQLEHTQDDKLILVITGKLKLRLKIKYLIKVFFR